MKTLFFSDGVGFVFVYISPFNSGFVMIVVSVFCVFESQYEYTYIHYCLCKMPDKHAHSLIISLKQDQLCNVHPGHNQAMCEVFALEYLQHYPINNGLLSQNIHGRQSVAHTRWCIWGGCFVICHIILDHCITDHFVWDYAICVCVDDTCYYLVSFPLPIMCHVYVFKFI